MYLFTYSFIYYIPFFYPPPFPFLLYLLVRLFPLSSLATRPAEAYKARNLSITSGRNIQLLMTFLMATTQYPHPHTVTKMTLYNINSKF